MKFLSKRLDSSWWFFILSCFTIFVYQFEPASIKYCVSLHMGFCSILFLTLIPIINITLNKDFMINILMPIIFSKMGKDEAIAILEEMRFFTLPIFLNIFCGGYFIWKIRDPYLVMSFIVMMFYFRVTDLIVRECMVRHIKYIDFVSGN